MLCFGSERQEGNKQSTTDEAGEASPRRSNSHFIKIFNDINFINDD